MKRPVSPPAKASHDARNQTKWPEASRAEEPTIGRRTGAMRQVLAWAGEVAVLGLFFLFLWRVIDPTLQYQVGAQAFFLERAFFKQFLNHPGGLLNWFTAFWLQAYSWAWLGALLTAGLLWLLCRATRFCLATRSPTTARCLYLFPAALLVGLESHYDLPAVRTLWGTTLTLSALACFLRFRRQPDWVRLSLFVLLNGFLCVVGGDFCGWFVLLAAIFELRASRSWARIAVALVLGGVLIPWAMAEMVFGAGFKAVYPHGFKPVYLAVIWFGFWPVAALAAIWAASRRPSHVASLNSPPDQPPTCRALAITFIGLTSVSAGLAYAGWDQQQKTALEMETSARQKDWAGVLAQARQLRVRHVGQELDLQRALYHAGLLPDEQFSYRQVRAQGLLLSFNETLNLGALALSESFVELGQVNYAEHWAAEAMAKEGETPAILRQLALVQRLKHHAAAARVFLNRLAQNPLYHRWASVRLQQLELDPAGAQDPELTQLQGLMQRSDRASSYLEVESLLKRCLLVNRHNRMAFEYLMAHYLLTRQLKRVVPLLGRLPEFDYSRIPRHYEEALLLYQRPREGQAVNFPPYQVDPQAVQRYLAFNSLLARFKGDVEAGRLAAEPEFGNTYWFYYVFGATATAPADAAPPPTSQ